MPGKIDFVPGEADYVSAMRANYRGQLASAKAWLRMLLPLLIGTALLIAALAAFGGQPELALVSGLVGLAAGGTLLILRLGICYLLIGRSARKLFGQQSSLHGTQALEWDDARLLWRGPDFAMDKPWGNFHRWHETGAEFLLYANDQMLQFIPRRSLDDAQAADLRKTLVEHGPPRR